VDRGKVKIPEKITGLWNLADAYMPKDAGTVFSCFSCAGGSTMGYKLAGFDVIGCNEIDPKVFAVYNANHKPKHPFVCSIRDMIDKDLPSELFELDILDGSPPCTSFSIAGNREKDWGRKKKFDEGQAYQRLDDLFFEFIALAKRLQPKTIISENVVGIIQGKAKGYVKEILRELDAAGYTAQVFKLNAAQMGVPQARQRVFFVSRRKDIQKPAIRLDFKEKPITFKEAASWLRPGLPEKETIFPGCRGLWRKCKPGKALSSVHPAGSYFNASRWSYNTPAPTLVAQSIHLQFHPEFERPITSQEMVACSSFPADFKFPDIKSANKKKWFLGMSVPPFMMQRIALEVRRQWLS
jgi:DNA (cytosine-5)-methyltransferase 1